MSSNFKSTKTFGPYPTAFRQWRASHSHCQYVHGWALTFKVVFGCKNLDDKNWVQDFGSFKRNGIKDWLNDMFDHTTAIAKDDPHINTFIQLDDQKIIQLRLMNDVGCEKFAEYVFNYMNPIIENQSEGRVRVISVECVENETNSAIYEVISE